MSKQGRSPQIKSLRDICFRALKPVGSSLPEDTKKFLESIYPEMYKLVPQYENPFWDVELRIFLLTLMFDRRTIFRSQILSKHLMSSRQAEKMISELSVIKSEIIQQGTMYVPQIVELENMFIADPYTSRAMKQFLGRTLRVGSHTNLYTSGKFD